jgi:dephospho-CoA kinase
METFVILRVGLTGGIASGKSTIARMLASLGCTTIDADALVAELYQQGHAGHEALVNEYGQDIIRPDGEIDRPKLAAIAFSSEAESRRLNSLIHPLVRDEVNRRIAELERAAPGDHIVVVEATLLLEAQRKREYDRIVVVDVPGDLQVERGTGRGMESSEVRRRMNHQMPREDRLIHADYTIDNSGDAPAALLAAQRIYEALRGDLTRKRDVGV